MLTVLFVAAEAVPFAKSGGLGEVIGSLPGALRRLGVDARVVMPLYRSIPPGLREEMALIKEITVPVGWRRQYCGIHTVRHRGVPFYFLDNEYYFARPRLYGYHDEAERFAFFARAVLESLPHMNFRPDIIHCHDWHAGLVPAYLAAHYRQGPNRYDSRAIFTIHNLKYQGVFDKSTMGDIVDLSWEHFTVNGVEFYDQVSFMKAGIVYADRITTVSPSYAEEIRQPFYGEQLDGLLRRRGGDLTGILNGIDCETYDPATDPNIFHRYGAASPEGKGDNKLKLQEMLGLPVQPATPLIAVVSRLVRQKGLDLIIRVSEEMLAMDVQLVVMGDGEDWYRAFFLEAAGRHGDKLAPQLAYDDAMARRIYAAADLFLMPSLFEPCGIAQLTAMRYGALPLVRETGGLRDTVVPYNRYTGVGNGFSFTNYNAHDMLHTIRGALSIYGNQPVWRTLVNSAMSGDYSWGRSARQYNELYGQIAGKEAIHAYQQERIPTGVSRQSGETARQAAGGNIRRRKVPSPQQPHPGLHWPQVAALIPGATGTETGLLPVY
jgi:glycogen/starch synthases, ADP-glucose type